MDLPEHLQAAFYGIEDLCERKLWHQLTEQLLALFSDPASAPHRLRIFKEFIVSFKQNINQLQLVVLGLAACVSCSHVEALAFLSELAASVNQPESQEAYVYARTEIANVELLLGNITQARAALDEVGKIMDNFNTLENVIYASYYRVNADYYKQKSEYSAYYRNALLYLACIDLKALSVEEAQSRAFNLCVAAVLGDTIYNFGELLLHPILDTLKGGEHEWLRDVIIAMNSGNIPKLDALSGHFTKQPLFQEHLAFLRQKICLAALTEAVFRRPPHDRQLSFQTIATETCLVTDEVEHLVMKALALGLLRGSIDEISKTINVSWIQPRVLDKDQIAAMRDRLVEWNERVQKLSVWMESEGKDVWAHA